MRTYDKKGRLLFTRRMKKTHTLLMPMMLPVHFELIRRALELHGYKAVLLKNSGPEVVEEGLRSVHNDACYPALLVIGQLLDAVKRGGFDENRIALMITQTGGGCRASNYIHLLRKALKRNGLEHIPVVSLNTAGMEKNPGFKLTLTLLARMIVSTIYGDLLMLLHNRCRSYEITPGDADRMVDKWQDILGRDYSKARNLRVKRIKVNFRRICEDFAKIPLDITEKPRVGVVGEIYVKYAPLGNNNLEKFLLSEGCEIVVPGLVDFIRYMVENQIQDNIIYGTGFFKRRAFEYARKLIDSLRGYMSKCVAEYEQFAPVAPVPFENITKYAQKLVSLGNKMGEGWLLSGEMLELIHQGVPNIVCTQPFGCLPNHIVGKGMIRPIKRMYPEANIVAIDYDPGATRVNQENRIKLMLVNAKEGLFEKAKQSVGIREKSVEYANH